MFSSQRLQEVMGLILLLGTFLATALVVIGGIQYVVQFGGDQLNVAVMPLNAYQTSIKHIFIEAMTLTPLAIIELGLFILVFTQILRVALLVLYYALIRDYWFTLISLFITLMLIYCLFWR